MEFKEIYKEDAFALPGVIVMPENLSGTITELNDKISIQIKGAMAYVVKDVLHFMQLYDINTLQVMYIDTDIIFAKSRHLS